MRFLVGVGIFAIVSCRAQPAPSPRVPEAAKPVGLAPRASLPVEPEQDVALPGPIATPAAKPPSTAPVVQLSARRNATCAVHEDGALSCWGDYKSTPRRMPIEDVAEVSLDGTRSCARTRDGRVACWGQISRTSQSDAPVAMPFEHVAQWSGSCARLESGDVWCLDLDARAAQVPAVAKAIDVAGTPRAGCAVETGGSVSCWHDSVASKIVGVTNAIDVVAGDDFACARRANGATWCWPWEVDRFETVPSLAATRERKVKAKPATPVPLAGDAIALAAAPRYACALRKNKTWTCNRPPPAKLAVPSPIVAFAETHGCAALGGRHVACWGEASTGALGNGWSGFHATPVAVPGITDAIVVDAAHSEGSSEERTCALRKSGVIACWGNTERSSYSAAVRDLKTAPAVAINTSQLVTFIGRDGKLWNPYLRDKAELLPMPVKAVQTSGECVVGADGSLWCFGSMRWSNEGEHIGDPVRVPGIDEVAEVSNPSAYANACARKTNGRVVCFRPQGPLEVIDGVTDAITLSSGAAASCALRADHTVTCWGAAPVAPVTMRDAIGVSVGASFACVVKQDSTVECWGANENGQLGDGTATEKAKAPVKVAGITDAIAISAGTLHACALRKTGEVACWGSARYGEIGTYATEFIATPSDVVWP